MLCVTNEVNHCYIKSQENKTMFLLLNWLTSWFHESSKQNTPQVATLHIYTTYIKLHHYNIIAF